ncbi:LamG domain-containing protein [bacterium]
MLKKESFAVLVIYLLTCSFSIAQDNDVLFWWKFDEGKLIRLSGTEGRRGQPATMESVTEESFPITGLAKYVPGVSGSAIKFDGFSSYIEGVPRFPRVQVEEDEWESETPRDISIEAWIALGAYPWNWAPIITIGKYKITGFYFGVDSRGRLGFHVSDATSVWHECNSRVNPKTRLGMELKKWYHVVATYSPKNGSKIYINGKLAGSYNQFDFDYGIAYSDIEKGFRMGMNRVALAPSDPIRDWATYPSRYTLDGIVDELKIHRGELTSKQVRKMYTSMIPENKPDFAPRQFPKVKPSGRFSAHFTRLKYYPEWDAIWPVGDHMDVVVQFDELPVNVMFWRGTRYSACWVSENGKWMADQSRETGNNWFLGQGSRNDMPTGCIEHMSDTQCRSSRVSILESNDARVVVNWRYLQMDVKFRQKDLPNNTGFGEWGNELYYIYPDGVGVRKVLPGRGGWQETILLNEPGTRPEDNVDLEACTLLNLKGESKTYSWEYGYPEFDLEDAVIQLTHFKSRFKPFMIFREGGSFEVFNLEVRPDYSHFPWWNHWPVAQVISDGRSASAPDRAAHSSLSWGDPNGEAALYGMTDQDPSTLVALARSWNRPPELNLSSEGYKSKGYDYTQRAYIIEKQDDVPSISFTLKGSNASPVINPAFVIHKWNQDNVQLKINGEDIPRGKEFRRGVEYTVEGDSDLIVWIKKKTNEDLKISLTAE